jgi:hypothetical protein
MFSLVRKYFLPPVCTLNDVMMTNLLEIVSHVFCLVSKHFLPPVLCIFNDIMMMNLQKVVSLDVLPSEKTLSYPLYVTY